MAPPSIYFSHDHMCVTDYHICLFNVGSSNDEEKLKKRGLHVTCSDDPNWGCI